MRLWMLWGCLAGLTAPSVAGRTCRRNSGAVDFFFCFG
nr:MAG TPA: hypothetical protein [Caudoviricetes sp.]